MGLSAKIPIRVNPAALNVAHMCQNPFCGRDKESIREQAESPSTDPEEEVALQGAKRHQGYSPTRGSEIPLFGKMGSKIPHSGNKTSSKVQLSGKRSGSHTAGHNLTSSTTTHRPRLLHPHCQSTSNGGRDRRWF